MKTKTWKAQRHAARVAKRTAKARQRAQNARKQRGMGASKTPQNMQIAPFMPFIELLMRPGRAAIELVTEKRVTVFQSSRRAA